MEEVTQLNEYLHAGQFQQAMTLALTQMLPAPQAQKYAWETLRIPGYTLTDNPIAGRGCPFLLGCRQAVAANAGEHIQQWCTALEHKGVVAFLRGRDQQPLSAWHYMQAVLACAEAALAIKRNDYNTMLQHGYAAAIWGSNTEPKDIPTDLPELLTKPDAPSCFAEHRIEQCFSLLAKHYHVKIGQARDLTLWLLPTMPQGQPERTRKIKVPLFERARGIMATLEMDLLAGNGEFYADPVDMAFRSWDTRFSDSQKNAQKHIHRCGLWSDNHDVRWRFYTDSPLLAVSGGSAGGAFFAMLWHLLKGILNDLSVTVSAQITPDGELRYVGHIQEKILEILKDTSLSTLVVAHDQKECTPGDYDAQKHLQIWKVRSPADPEHHGPTREK